MSQFYSDLLRAEKERIENIERNIKEFPKKTEEKPKKSILKTIKKKIQREPLK